MVTNPMVESVKKKKIHQTKQIQAVENFMSGL